MRTLIIPDIHNHTENADHWLQSQRYDRVVFLGDYFDDFDDTPRDAMTTARWLRDRMEAGGDIFLLGNHDVSYRFPDSPELECPGFTPQKSRAIHPFLGAGEDRGGLQKFGGPLWMDFDSLVPIPKINQIVGHTPGRVVREKITSDSKNYCLDVRHASAAALLCDGKLTILNKESSCPI